MIFQIKLNNEIHQTSSDLHHKLEDFFIAHAVIISGELCCYLTNNDRWFVEFQKNWKDDPIVSMTPPIQEKFSLVEWGYNLVKPEHKCFFDHRYNITGADSGFTAFKSSFANNQLISEFYAIGSTENCSFSQSLILDPLFVKQAFRSFIPKLKKYAESP